MDDPFILNEAIIPQLDLSIAKVYRFKFHLHVQFALRMRTLSVTLIQENDNRKNGQLPKLTRSHYTQTSTRTFWSFYVWIDFLEN
jgi:hypothetical protein